jgi:hypothetical protein
MTDDAAAEAAALRRRLSEIEDAAARAASPRWWRAETIAGLRPDQYEAHRGEILAAMNAGRVLRAGRAAPGGAEVAELPRPRAYSRAEIAAMGPDEYAAARPDILEGLRAASTRSTKERP